MIEWYKDEEISIFFSGKPKIKERIITPGMSSELIKSIKKYPYTNLKNLDVSVFDHINKKSYHFTIPKYYCFDGASIPGKIILKILIGSKTDNRFLVGAMIHDWMCEHHGTVGYNRNLSSKVFKALLLVGGTPPLKAHLMYLGVDLFQRTQGWKEPDEKDD